MGQGEDRTDADTRRRRRAGGDRSDGGRPGLGVHALDPPDSTAPSRLNPPLAIAPFRVPPICAAVAAARSVAKPVVGIASGAPVAVAVREPYGAAGPGHRGAAQP